MKVRFLRYDSMILKNLDDMYRERVAAKFIGVCLIGDAMAEFRGLTSAMIGSPHAIFPENWFIANKFWISDATLVFIFHRNEAMRSV